jgi:hypothetical protein
VQLAEGTPSLQLAHEDFASHFEAAKSPCSHGWQSTFQEGEDFGELDRC